MYGRKPTKAEKEWMNEVSELGCIVCRNMGGIFSPASPHHMHGRTRRDCHLSTIPLCGAHHQTGGEGVAFHATGKKTWQEKYGTQEELLKQCQEIINGNHRD